MASTVNTGQIVVSRPHIYTIMLRLIIAIGIISGLGILAISLTALIPIFKSYEMEILTITISGLFLGITMGIVLKLADYTARPKMAIIPRVKIPDMVGNSVSMKFKADTNSILIGEFEYARETATQAMEERRSVMNIYLLIAGGAGSGVVAFLSSNNDNTKAELQLAAVALLWLVYLIGWLTLFKLIALRRAWGNSAIAMNYIKEFYIDYAKDMGLPDGYLDSAFFWKATTIPPPHAHWNVFHYSNLLIALLDAAALVAGAMLVDIYLKGTAVYIITVTGCLLAMALIMAHWWTYDIALTPR